MEVSTERPLRIGILGAARIAPGAIVEPARERQDVDVASLAAREPARARAFAREPELVTAIPKHGGCAGQRATGHGHPVPRCSRAP